MITTTMAIEILIEALAVSEALTKKTEKNFIRYSIQNNKCEYLTQK